MRSLRKTMLSRMNSKSVRKVSGYIDFGKIPREYRYVAVDSVDSLDTLGRVVFEAGRPVAYSDPVHFVSGLWVFTAQRPGDMPRKPPVYVPESAIVGQIPTPSESLVHRKE